jgi:hypothetical protein
LFGLFASVEMRTDHVDFTHAFPLLPHSTGAWRRGAERMASRWGWYVTVFARK